MTYTISQKGRYFFIYPLPDETLKKEIQDKTTYCKKNIQFMPNPEWGVVRLYSVKLGKFPIGLLETIKQCFINQDKEFVVHKKSMEIDFSKPISKELRLYQQSAVRKVLINHGGIVSMPTGSGKSRVGIEIIEYLDRLSLVIVPTLDLKKQWERQVPKGTVVATYQSLKSKSYIQQFGLVIFDECHVVGAKSLQLIALNLSADSITVGLSATPTMRDEDNMKVYAALGDMVYHIDLKYLIKCKYLSNAKVFYHTVTPLKNDMLDYPLTYNKYIVYNDERNRKICSIACESKNVLILVDRIEHGDILLDMLSFMSQDVVFLHGNSKNRDDLDHNIIVATSIFDLGIDIPRLETLILGAGGKSTIKTIQRMGRVLRLFKGKSIAHIHDFKDNCRWLDKHYRERRAIFAENFDISFIKDRIM